MPGQAELFALMQKQTEALTGLPRTLADLQSAVRELTETANQARETVASAQRTATRLEALVDELAEPVRRLKPGLERVGRVLDDPVIDTVPAMLATIQDDLVPLIHLLRQAQSRVSSVATRLRRRPLASPSTEPATERDTSGPPG